jgi:carotenoid cleavage dioxygenase-like enzyme
MGLTTFGATFEYQSAPGSRVVVASKKDMSIVADVRLPAFSTFHFANAYEEGGKLHVLVNRLVSYWEPFQKRSRHDLYEFALREYFEASAQSWRRVGSSTKRTKQSFRFW